jgi:hypothetical protein
MHKFITIMEWIVGFVGSALVAPSIFFVMFSDSPTFFDKLSSLQSFVVHWVYLFMIGVPALYFISIIARLVSGSPFWSHVAGVIGLIGIIYAIIFYSIYL